eukprot:TRINITY_DN9515_c0_g2_i1.p1 TRINITY_DN9515_c0_g2~~TRINITY_DN9515_c0_g2_i1.p1  ORF type:complete len:451 (+),score=60.73 TRINITY_DN9515_c0_g2_i1:95-1447(+)
MLYFKEEHELNYKTLLSLGKLLKLGLTRAQVMNTEYFKSRETMNELKEKLAKILWSTLNAENKIIPEQIFNSGCSKAYIANGNNSAIVKATLKQRWWWTITDSSDNANLVWTQWKKHSIIKALPCTTCEFNKKILKKACNHVEGNEHLGNKKELLHNMKIYYEALGRDPFAVIPLSFHVSQGIEDEQFSKFVEAFKLMKGKNVWIIKPGENSNRGQGIRIYKELEDIKQFITAHRKGTYIIQKYIEKPLLINKRKFDIRCYGFVTAYNGYVKGYFYNEGYLRTSSREFSLHNLSAKIVHLTNEAIQQKYEDFGKYEPGNKMTYAEFNEYLKSTCSKLKVDFYSDILPRVKGLVADSMRAAHGKLDPNGRQQTFEIFGYDFMLDEDCHLYLIEANINPCLEVRSPVTARIVPAMLQSTFKVALDPLFQLSLIHICRCRRIERCRSRWSPYH